MPKAIVVILILILYASCNFYNQDLLGVYIIDRVKGDTITQKYVKELHINKNGIAKIIYSDTIIIGKWDEIDIQEFNLIQLVANGKVIELYIEKKGTIKLDVSNPSNFRGWRYDSLSFIKVK